MCSSLENNKTQKKAQTNLSVALAGKNFQLAPKIKGGLIGTSSRCDLI
jgi:hypothetical protein